jgi:hypothetical protein
MTLYEAEAFSSWEPFDSYTWSFISPAPTSAGVRGTPRAVEADSLSDSVLVDEVAVAVTVPGVLKDHL